MPDDTKPASVAFTTSVFFSPEFLGGVATLIGLSLNKFGVHIFDDPASQQNLIIVLGIVFTGIAHYLFPGASGKLSVTGPAPWTVPPSQPVSSGTSVIAVPAPADEKQTTGVLPLAPGAHRVEITAPVPAPVVPPAPPVLPPTVTVTPSV